MRDRIRTFPAPASPPPSTSGGHGWTLESVAAGLAEALKKRGHTVAVSECTSGGLLAASLLSLPGASAYFTGGAVAYAAVARQALIPGTHDELRALELVRGSDNYASPERYWESRVVWATSAARDARLRCGADWGIAEVGAAGPSFHRATGVHASGASGASGEGSGFVVVAVVGPGDAGSATGARLDARLRAGQRGGTRTCGSSPPPRRASRRGAWRARNRWMPRRMPSSATTLEAMRSANGVG